MPEKILWLSEMMKLSTTETGERFVTVSDSGYGRASFDIVTRLLDRKKDVVVADWRLPHDVKFQTPKKKALCRVYGIATEEEIYGKRPPTFGRERLQKLLEKIKPGLLIAFGDLRMVQYLVEEIPDRPPTVYIFPVDGENIPERWLPILECFDEIVTISRFGENEVKKAGLKSQTIPLGVDTEKFKPLPEDDLKICKVSEGLSNGFVAGYCGRNQQRKNLPALFDGFYRFNRDYKNSCLYLHTDPVVPPGIGWNLTELIELVAEKYTKDIEKKAEFFDKILFSFEQNPSGVVPFEQQRRVGNQPTALPSHGTTETNSGEKEENKVNERIRSYDPLCRYYNMLSVHTSCTMSEGFGLTVLESLACGIPQVVPGHTALPELADECGELVKIDREVITPSGTINYDISIEDLVEKLTRLYNDPQLREKYSENAVRKAKRYDYNNCIVPRWMKLIEKF